MKAYRIKSGIRSSVDENGLLMLVSESESKNCFYKFEGISKDVFFGIRDQKTVPTIIQDILSEYDVEPSKVENDVQKLIGFFLSNEIIEEA